MPSEPSPHAGSQARGYFSFSHLYTTHTLSLHANPLHDLQNGRIEHLDDVRSVERRRTREITQAAQVVLSHHYHEVQRQTRFSVQGAPCDIEDVTLCE